jgi:two-component system response regulator NreC
MWSNHNAALVSRAMMGPPAPSASIEVILADDHPVVRSALRALLEAEEGLQVVAEVGDAEAAILETGAHAAPVLLLDLNMPGKSSLAAIAELAASGSKTRVVVLTMENQPALAREALNCGAIGYVLKQAAEREVVNAVRAAARGETYVQPEVEAGLQSRSSGPPDGLTDREVEVLGLIALGHPSGEIAARLDLSARTVESHRAHIQQKLRLDRRSELVRYALDHGLIPLD